MIKPTNYKILHTLSIICFVLLSVFDSNGVLAEGRKVYDGFKPAFEEKLSYEIDKMPPAPPTLLSVEVVDGANRYDYIKNLIEKLNYQDPNIRKEAGKELYDKIADTELKIFIENFTDALNNKDPVVRRYSTAILLKIGPSAYTAVPALIEALEDPDPAVRLNAAGALGRIGRNAHSSVTALITLLDDVNEQVRAYAIRALGFIGSDAKAAIPALINKIDDKNYLIREYAINALGDTGPEASTAIPILIKAYEKEKNPFFRNHITDTIRKIAVSLSDVDAVYALPDLENIQTTLSDNNDPIIQENVKIINRSIKYLNLRKTRVASSGFHEAKLLFENDVPTDLINTNELKINGNTVSINKIEPEIQAIYFLDDNNFVKKGLNYLENGRNRLYYWFEENKLKKFQEPYKRSYAIIAAIDDYDREKDSKGRKATGYRNLDFMVDDAKQLVKALETLGFPRENIFEFYNEAATATTLDEILKKFWTGGEYDSINNSYAVDRLFFYFGGHGDVSGESPYLVTYDFQKKTPTLSSLLMHDLTMRHFENLKVHHVFVALDSCLSGLALPRFQGVDDEEERLKAFLTLSIIKGDTAARARNVLVAGKGDQKALWINGGIFTKSLIAGLKGNADYNNDGIIQFAELSLFVKNQVRAKANETGFNQDPESFQADRFGNGNVLFLRP